MSPLERGRRLGPGVVLDPVAHRLGQVESLAVALQAVDDPQGVLVVAEADPVALEQEPVEHVLADVAEGRVTEVVP